MNQNTKLILFCTILLGAFLRLYNIGFQCFWTEEQYTIDIVKLPLLQLIYTSFTSDFTPPLYYIIAHFIDMRIASAAFGILLIPVMYYVGEKYKDECTGLYCAGITAFLFPLVYYSQFGRSYSLSLLLFAITMYYYISHQQDGGSEVMFCLSSILCIYCSIMNAIPILFLVLTMWYGKTLHLLCIGLFTSPLLLMVYNMITQRTNAVASFGMPFSQMLVITPIELFGGSYIAALILLCMGYYYDRSKLVSNLMIVAIITILIEYAASFLMPVFPRYFIILDVIFILVISTFLGRVQRNKTVVYFVVMSCMLLLQYYDFIIHYTIQKYIC